MTITLRQESATGASTKGSALTYAELDNNFIDLLNASRVTVRADSGTDETLGNANLNEILSVVGGTNVTTALTTDSAGEITLTINSTASGGVVDINGTGAITVDETSAGGVTISTSALSNVVEDTTPQLGGTLDCQGNKIQNPVLEDYAETVYSLGSTDTPTLTVSNGNVQKVTISAGLTLPEFSDAAPGQSITLIVSGSGTASGSTSSAGNAYVFAGGNTTLTTLSVVSIFYDGVQYYASIATDFQ